jgi:hypothetical protein
MQTRFTLFMLVQCLGLLEDGEAMTLDNMEGQTHGERRENCNETLERLMQSLFLETGVHGGGASPVFSSDRCYERIVRRVAGVAQDVMGGKNDTGLTGTGYNTEDELEPADHWHGCFDVVKMEWEAVKRENPGLHPWFRRAGNEVDNRKHLEDILQKLGDTWRTRDYLLNLMDSQDGVRDSLEAEGVYDLRPMALFMLAVVRAEELETEGIKVTRAVRAKYGDEEGLPQALEGLLGGQRSVAWWLRESEMLAVDGGAGGDA